MRFAELPNRRTADGKSIFQTLHDNIRERISERFEGQRITEHADPVPTPAAPQATGTLVQTVEALVTVGPEHAVLLSKRLGREVKPGEQFDLGTVSQNGQPVGLHMFSTPDAPPLTVVPTPGESEA